MTRVTQQDTVFLVKLLSYVSTGTGYEELKAVKHHYLL